MCMFKMIYLDLVLDSGKLIRIECPDKHYDALYESLANAIQIGESWSPERFHGCKAEFLGMPMSSIYMGKVVGML